MSQNSEAKYEAKKPEDLKHIGAELRKTNIAFSMRPTPTGKTEQMHRYQGMPVMEHAVYVGDILGKDLKASHIDFGNGQSRGVKDWQGTQAAEMSRHEGAKFVCKQPNAALDTAALRVSSVPLGSAYE
jgi:hypothetical protein